tara:strand:+ start:173 stop:472 length:300 start_codon:yes stop_codon:yes gene_type:complete
MTNIIDNLPNKELLIELIEDIRIRDIDQDDEYIDITVACNGDDPQDWGFQTGDNSYSGACYFYRHWAIGSIDFQTDPKELATDLLDQLEELVAYEQLDC